MDDLVSRMAIQSDVALTFTLKQNIYLVFACILNRIPLIITGFPGLSKTLATNLVLEKLQDNLSEDPYLQ